MVKGTWVNCTGYQSPRPQLRLQMYKGKNSTERGKNKIPKVSIKVKSQYILSHSHPFTRNSH